MHVLAARGLISAKASDSRKKPSTPWPAKISLNGSPASTEPAARNPSGISITIGLSCASSPVLAVVRLAVERLEDQPPGIERGEQCRRDRA